MLMSQAAISACVTGLPRLGPAAIAALDAIAHSAAIVLGVDMLHLAFRVDRPAGDGVEVLVGEAEHAGRLLRLAALGDELAARRLDVAGLVPGAALQHRGAPVPAPQRAKAREGFAVHRPLQRRLRPARAAV